MSFILDALKKSESDRLKRSTPGFSHVPDKAEDKTASHWIWIVVVLIVINIGVLAVMFMRPEAAPTTSESPGRANVDAPPARVEPPPPAVAGAASQAEANPSTRPAEPRPAAAVAPPVQTTVQTPAPSAASPAPEPGNFEVTESYVTFNDLRAQGLLKVPDLHLDIHVFSDQAADRFVFVNMSKYKENETLDEGPLVSTITPEGVILVHRGLTFLLPRE
jgi:general secretion pathway protein B